MHLELGQLSNYYSFGNKNAATTSLSSNGDSSPHQTQAPPSVILGWSRSFVEHGWLRSLGLETCPTLGCLFTTDRSTVYYASMIVFCCGAMSWTEDVPPVRFAWQRYVLMIIESPANTNVDYSTLLDPRARRFFNWTASYRRDSDIDYSYGYFRQLEGKRRGEALLSKRTKFAVQFSSNCQTWSQRELIIGELRTYVEVDVYGVCGSLNCTCDDESDATSPPWIHVWCPKCISKLRDYRFYLAFENSVCRDYISEKFFHRLNVAAIVPVVLYASNYRSIAPPHSYIALDDFPSVEALAVYLKFLASNETAYGEYLSWRRSYVAVEGTRAGVGLCPLCQKLKSAATADDAEQTILDDPYRWWVEEGECVANFSQRFLRVEPQRLRWLDVFFV